MVETVRAGDVELRFERRGEGPPVLLIAGLGDPLEIWQAQLEALAGERTLIAFDNRGVGGSTLPDGPFDIATMADDAAALLDALAIAEPVHVAGFSMGGAIAQELALRHPERVRSLLLSGTWAGPDRRLTSLFEHWRWMTEAAPTPRARSEGIALWVFTPRAHADGTVEAAIEAFLADPNPQPLEAFRRTLDACIGHDARDRLGAITAPTLVCHGDIDAVCPPAANRALAELIPGAEITVLEGEGHLPLIESPERFGSVLTGFWTRVESAERGG